MHFKCTGSLKTIKEWAQLTESNHRDFNFQNLVGALTK